MGPTGRLQLQGVTTVLSLSLVKKDKVANLPHHTHMVNSGSNNSKMMPYYPHFFSLIFFTTTHCFAEAVRDQGFSMRECVFLSIHGKTVWITWPIKGNLLNPPPPPHQMILFQNLFATVSTIIPNQFLPIF